MKRTITFFLLMVCVGCGVGMDPVAIQQDVNATPYECTVPYLHLYRSQEPVGCDIVRHDVEIAHILLTTAWENASVRNSYPWDPTVDYAPLLEDPASHAPIKPIATEEFFKSGFSSVDVFLLSNQKTVTCGSSKPVFGCYDNNSVIELTDISLLLHEMLHHFEKVTGVPNTGDHPDWNGKGFYTAIAMFENFQAN